jgi:Signal peptidase, peptidase S26
LEKGGNHAHHVFRLVLYAKAAGNSPSSGLFSKGQSTSCATRFANITTKSHGGGGGGKGRAHSRRERRLQERKAKIEETRQATVKTLVGKMENKASSSSLSSTASTTVTTRPAAASTMAAAAAATSATFQARLQAWFRAMWTRASESAYTQEQAMAMAQRWPFALLITGFFLWEETSPYTLIRLKGPSMLPTLAADQSDIFLRSTQVWWKRFGLPPTYKAGDLVGFAHPEHPRHVSCKRVIGVAGDRVARCFNPRCVA